VWVAKTRLILGENTNVIDKQQQYSKQYANNTNTATVVHTGPNKIDNYNGYNDCPQGRQSN